MITDWRPTIIEMVRVKQEQFKLDKNRIFPHHFPQVAASESELLYIETVLGFCLDTNYRCFLSYANGWKGFFHTVTLFGTNEFSDPRLMDSAYESLVAITDAVYTAGYSIDELLPIAVATKDIDKFVLTKPTSPEPGTIIWFAGEEIERFRNFDQFYLSMLEYNRLTCIDLIQGKY